MWIGTNGYVDDRVTRFVVRDRNYKELNVCADERVANAYCDYYNELESMKGCKVHIEKRRPESEEDI